MVTAAAAIIRFVLCEMFVVPIKPWIGSIISRSDIHEGFVFFNNLYFCFGLR